MEQNKKYRYQRIVDAKEFIDTNFSDYINLDMIIRESCISKFHFSRLFKETYGLTPHQYLTQKRIGKAKTLLRDSNMPIWKLCKSIGFESASSFTHLFKRSTDMTPSEFRKKAIVRKRNNLNNPLGQIPGCYTLQHEKIE